MKGTKKGLTSGINGLSETDPRGKIIELINHITHTGMRQGELLGLIWKDIDWINRQIHVQRQLQRNPNGSLVFSEPKTAAGRRTIVISPTIIDSLRKHPEEKEEFNRKSTSNKFCQHFFTSGVMVMAELT
jgi:integrase